MKLHIYTAQIGKYKGPDAHDVTVKTGDRTFAPTWDMVTASKAGALGWETYKDKYRQLMLDSYRKNTDAWLEVLHKDELTLLCYCRAGENCHRYLLAEFLCKLGEKEGIRVIDKGERPLPEKTEEAIKDKPSSQQQSLF